jgi:hypothetical protein
VLSPALRNFLIGWSMLEDPWTCTGLGMTLIRNAVARWLAAWRGVLETIGSVRVPVGSPLGDQLDVQ